MTTKLYPYQKAGVTFFRDADGTGLLGDQVGLGKTVQSLHYAWKYLPTDAPGPIVVVAPAHLKETWKREAVKHVKQRVEVLSGEKVPAEKPPPYNPNQIYVINPEILTPDLWKSRTPPPDNSWIVWLSKLKPRLLIGDEAHTYSNPTSARTRGFRWLARKTPRTILLTGTPISNKVEGFWSLLNILWPKEFDSRWEYCQEYTHPIKTKWGWSFKGARNLDKLHARLKGRMLRRRKADVLKDLPAVTYSVVPIGCDLTEYRKAERDVIAWITEQDAAAGERAGKAAELAKLNALTQLAAASKIDAVVTWVQNFLEESDSKLLLGAIHYKITGALMDALGEQAVLVDGTLSEQRKNAAFDKFNLDPRCRVLVGNILAAGTGWSCTSASDVAIIEVPWRPADVEQFAGRCHGVGRGVAGTPTTVHLLLAAFTIEEKMCEGLQTKQAWANQAIDGEGSVGNFNVHDQVRKHLKSLGR